MTTAQLNARQTSIEYGMWRSLFSKFRNKSGGQNSQSQVPDARTQYQVGGTIGAKYYVKRILGGEGLTGFGEVYVCLNITTGETVALKTFQSRFIANREARNLFAEEVGIWINIPPHPYIVKANWIEEVSGRLFLQMEYIEPDDQGRNSLSHYLTVPGLPLELCLKWSIEICCGMEFAYEFGIDAHRDLKPDNILISSTKCAKITDFGIAKILVNDDSQTRPIGRDSGNKDANQGFGSPIWMAPEQFARAQEANMKNDIYSLGIMLYQMRNGGIPPFLSHAIQPYIFWSEMYSQHAKCDPPVLNSRIWPIISKCIQKSPSLRYQSFTALRNDLQKAYKSIVGEFHVVESIVSNSAEELNNRGASLNTLGKHREALTCLERAASLAPNNSSVWLNMGVTLYSLGEVEKSIKYFDKALSLKPEYAAALNNKGICLAILDDRIEAQIHFDKAVKAEPGYAAAWINGGRNLAERGFHELALDYFDCAIKINEKSSYAWNMKSDSLRSLGQFDKALSCLDRAIEINPFHCWALFDKADLLDQLKRKRDAVQAWRQFIDVAQNDPAQEERVAIARSRLQR